jgi:hypothetical protein
MRRHLSFDRFVDSTGFHFMVGILPIMLTSYGMAGRDGRFWLDTGIEVGGYGVSWQFGRNKRRNERLTLSLSLDAPRSRHTVNFDRKGVFVF